MRHLRAEELMLKPNPADTLAPADYTGTNLFPFFQDVYYFDNLLLIFKRSLEYYPKV